ncbi:hypothetical protein TD95_000136 [Thielaviopsis punctulata]|uniref:Non-structural maintenance of chromosomes element 4 n=1 Tax=Thielaviopsis punctulata TaxID=72032 RepID=A0A0F4Z995_9PEZI|nr:hypothetical protein TD95_000136 [Thielaviopsis punctulata]
MQTHGHSSSASKRRHASPSAGSFSRLRTSGPDREMGNIDLEDPSNVYDPDQPIEQRRQIQQGLRELSRKLADDPDEYLKATSAGLRTVLQTSNRINQDIRQTTEAAIDSRLLVTVADMSYRKTMRLMQGSTANGLDIDDFLTHAIRFMRHGSGIADDDSSALSATQRHRHSAASRRIMADSDDDEDGSDSGAEESGDMLNWEHLGRYAALPCSGRGPAAGFLLGPIHVEKKARKIAKRSAPLRPNMLPETRPEVLDTNALAKVDNDLTVICAMILQQLGKAQGEIQDELENLMVEENTDEENVRLMHAYGLRSTGGVDLMRFVVNPHSYAQTVENMFYVSFLIRDGKVSVEFDDDGIPSLSPTAPFSAQDQDPGSRSADARHQAIFTLDKHTWRDIVETLGIRQPMIPHRTSVASEAPGAQGWYS